MLVRVLLREVFRELKVGILACVESGETNAELWRLAYSSAISISCNIL
jgi:hypothetical protein